jgi:hypothetical protein
MSILSDTDLYRLTGFKRASCQRQVLREKGIPFQARGSETIVMEQHVEAWVLGKKIPKYAEPDLSAVK